MAAASGKQIDEFAIELFFIEVVLNFNEDFAEPRLLAGRPRESVAVAGAMFHIHIDEQLA